MVTEEATQFMVAREQREEVSGDKTYPLKAMPPAPHFLHLDPTS
jgi:hypothetical protein